MNDKIKQVLKNHNILYPQINETERTKVTSLSLSVSIFEKILIDICELQKEECAEEFNNIFISLNSKNVAE
jgi:hypothetical protein